MCAPPRAVREQQTQPVLALRLDLKAPPPHGRCSSPGCRRRRGRRAARRPAQDRTPARFSARAACLVSGRAHAPGKFACVIHIANREAPAAHGDRRTGSVWWRRSLASCGAVGPPPALALAVGRHTTCSAWASASPAAASACCACRSRHCTRQSRCDVGCGVPAEDSRCSDASCTLQGTSGARCTCVCVCSSEQARGRLGVVEAQMPERKGERKRGWGVVSSHMTARGDGTHRCAQLGRPVRGHRRCSGGM